LTAKLYLGDCLDVMRGLAPDSVHAIVTDPPYHLTQVSRGGSPRQNDPKTPFGRTRLGEKGFMGQTWDGGGVAFEPETWAEAFRVLKPGGHMLAFGGTRTYHRMVCAIEDAGFEIRDCIFWAFGSGFPKSRNIGGGLGTALKPAVEPIVLARKPLSEKTVAANVLRHGTGALNIDGCKVAANDKAQFPAGVVSETEAVFGGGNGRYANRPRTADAQPNGRWPSHLITDGSAEVTAAFPVTSGGASSGGRATPKKIGSSIPLGGVRSTVFHADTGSAARFFQACPPDSRIAYFPKPSRRDRDAGLEGVEPQTKRIYSGGITSADHPETAAGGGDRLARNVHPTVKPTSLMRYLCRLVTPPGGTVLDCFAGSGSTGRGAVLEGFDFIGIEQSAEFAAIARKRIAAAQREAIALDIHAMSDGHDVSLTFRPGPARRTRATTTPPPKRRPAQRKRIAA
jgi:site-specific DNA-methyltransferase (adenine-specific)